MRSAERGQYTVEMAVLLVVVVVALTGFFAFMRNAVSARVKTGVDTFGHGLLADPCRGLLPWDCTASRDTTVPPPPPPGPGPDGDWVPF